MVSICFYFQVHQPRRLREYPVFDIGYNHHYFNTQKNEEIIKKVATKCYLPANKLILDLINQTDGKFKVSFSITGVILEQFELYYPQVIESFKRLVETGSVELLDETYYHSLAGLFSKNEFKKQVDLHRKKIWSLFKFK